MKPSSATSSSRMKHVAWLSSFPPKLVVFCIIASLLVAMSTGSFPATTQSMKHFGPTEVLSDYLAHDPISITSNADFVSQGRDGQVLEQEKTRTG